MKIAVRVGAGRRTALCFYTLRHAKPHPASGAYLFLEQLLERRGAPGDA